MGNVSHGGVAAVEFKNYTKTVIVSGDGDFRCLHEYLIKNGKLFSIIIPNKYSESSLLDQFQEFKVFLYREMWKLELIPNKSGIFTVLEVS